MFSKKNKSLSSQIILITIIIILLYLTFMVLAVMTNQEKAMENAVKNRGQSLEGTLTRVSASLDQVNTDLRDISRDVYIMDLMESAPTGPVPSENPETLRKLFRISLNPIYTGVSFADKNGKPVYELDKNGYVKKAGINGRGLDDNTISRLKLNPLIYELIGDGQDDSGLRIWSEIRNGKNEFVGYTTINLDAEKLFSPFLENLNYFQDSNLTICENSGAPLMSWYKNGLEIRQGEKGEAANISVSYSGNVAARIINNEEPQLITKLSKKEAGVSGSLVLPDKQRWIVLQAFPRNELITTGNETYAAVIIGCIILLISLSIIYSKIQKSFIRPLKEIGSTAKAIADGDLTRRVGVLHESNTNTLGTAINSISQDLGDVVTQLKTLNGQLNRSSSNVNEISLNLELGVESQNSSVTNTAASLDEMNSSIQTLAESAEVLSDSTLKTSSLTMEMAASVNNISQNIESMSSSVIQSATSIENMIGGIHSVTESSESMLESAEGTQERLEHLETSMRNVLDQIRKGGISAEEIIKNTQRGLEAFSKSQDGLTRIEEMVRSTRESIISLSRGSEDIGDIVGIINEIADQTNLLSLNAAIIAASAGEHGRSFAVVADEIRELSERTQNSTRDIAKVIRTVQTQVGDVTEEINIGSEKVEEGLELAAMAGQILSNIFAISEDHYTVTQDTASSFDNHFKETNKMMEGVQDLATKTRQITLAMREQKLGSQLILSTIEDIQDATRKTVVSINEHSKGSQALSMSMEDLAKRVESIFKAIEVIRKGVEKIINEQEIIRYATSETLVGTRKLREIFQEIELESEELESLVKQFKTKPLIQGQRKENGLKPKETEENI